MCTRKSLKHGQKYVAWSLHYFEKLSILSNVSQKKKLTRSWMCWLSLSTNNTQFAANHHRSTWRRAAAEQWDDGGGGVPALVCVPSRPGEEAALQTKEQSNKNSQIFAWTAWIPDSLRCVQRERCVCPGLVGEGGFSEPKEYKGVPSSFPRDNIHKPGCVFRPVQK